MFELWSIELKDGPMGRGPCPRLLSNDFLTVAEALVWAATNGPGRYVVTMSFGNVCDLAIEPCSTYDLKDLIEFAPVPMAYLDHPQPEVAHAAG